MTNILNNKEFAEKHNKLVEELFNNNIKKEEKGEKTNILEEIPQIKVRSTPEDNYNVFFIKSGSLYEFQTTEKKLVKKNLGTVTTLSVRECIYNEVVKQNKHFRYEDDITIFSVEEAEQDEDLNLKNDGRAIVILITIIFIINFMLNNPQSIYVK